MLNKKFKLFFFTFIYLLSACGQGSSDNSGLAVESKLSLAVEKTELYFPLLESKNIALVANHTSMLGNKHLADSLISAGVKLKKVFSPEHGFRGSADAGEKVEDDFDKKTGLPIISLYGANKKPYPSQLKGIDVIVFDIQDVGARFYTYISTLHYVMEAAAEQKILLIVLDRPNPNGHYIDGPVLKKQFQSFVGMHPVPIVHGMTIGEYAKMINGEAWLKNEVKCELKVIQCENYNHNLSYDLPIKPSPNLPNMRAVYLYPSLCLFEGTAISVGRGTKHPFQQIGHPSLKSFDHHFTPKPSEGAKNPKLKNTVCHGIDFTHEFAGIYRSSARIDLSYLISFYELYPQSNTYFTPFFNLLAGNEELQRQIKSGLSEAEIRKSWEQDLEMFKKVRSKYLLYP